MRHTHPTDPPSDWPGFAWQEWPPSVLDAWANEKLTCRRRTRYGYGSRDQICYQWWKLKHGRKPWKGDAIG